MKVKEFTLCEDEKIVNDNIKMCVNELMIERDKDCRYIEGGFSRNNQGGKGRGGNRGGFHKN